MRIINNNIALGIEWDTFETKAATKTKLAGGKLKYLAYKAEGVFVQGVVEHAGWRAKLYSGAQLVASRNENVVVYHSLGDDEVWVTAATGGRPIIGFDRVCTPDQANRLIAEALNLLPSAIRVGDMSGATVGLEQYLELVPKKRYGDALLKSTAAPAIQLGIVVAVMLVCGVVAFGINLYSEHRQSSAEAQQQEAARLAAQAAALKHQKELKAAVDKARSEVLNAVPPSKQMALWRGFLGELPFSQDGWYPLVVKCEPDHCDVHWERFPQALPSAGKQLPGEFLTTDPEGVTTRFSFEKLATTSSTSAIDIETYLNDLGSTNFGVTMKSKPATINVTPQLPAPFTANEAQDVIGHEGTFEIVSDSILALSDISPKLDQPGVRLVSMQITGFSGGRRTAPIIVSGAYRVAK